MNENWVCLIGDVKPSAYWEATKSFVNYSI